VQIDDELPQQDPEVANSKRANAVDVEIGYRLRMRRMLIGMSQERLGDMLKVTFQQVQKYERGTNRVSASRLYDLAKILGVQIDYFFESLIDKAAGPGPGFAESDSDETAMHNFLGTKEGIELNRAFLRITDATKRRAVIELVRSMAGQEAK
jgi:transcriptional regulator with XRE-family HTH domain